MRTTDTRRKGPSSGRRRAMVAGLVLGLPWIATAPAVAIGAHAASSALSSTRRVDLATPVFSNPTAITNPLFAVGSIDQSIQLGAEGDVVLRHEITLLDATRTIRWDGRDIEAVVTQFVAYGDGEILEVATDYFAQADDGSVWYLGEDVANYEGGVVVNHDGTWLAGRDGPGGMIMPADPQVGDVYRPENIPGLVFEEVTVRQTNVTVEGPRGPVSGAILVQERLMDGTLEDKVFAPGYGEFQAHVPTADELVTVAISVPTDHADQREPAHLDRLAVTARRLAGLGTTREWSRIVALAGEAHRHGDALSAGDVPPLLADQLAGAFDALDAAIESRSRADVRQAGIELELASLDLELRYDDADDVDEDRIDVWRLQRRVHLAAGDAVAAASDRAIIAAIDARLSS